MKCPYCEHVNDEDRLCCASCNHALRDASTPINWKNEIKETIDGYETEPAKGLVHGLQKDAIQNGWGHRANKKGNGWKFVFELKKINNKTLLLLTDEGTTGLTGPNMTMAEVNNKDGDFPPDYKLVRFSAMKYSGGNQGAGLYGRGKLLFQGASKETNIYFDSLCEKEGYRANYRILRKNDLKQAEKALEGEAAKKLIKENLGLEPLAKIGTRVIIVEPLDSIVESIRNGEFEAYIQETWWLIIRNGAEIFISDGKSNRRVSFPKVYGDLPEKSESKWKVWFRNNIKISADYKIRRIHLLISPQKLPEDFRGVHLYRKGMKVGGFEISDLHADIKNNYFGYVELDKDSESTAELIEDLTHYGFKNKRRLEYQQLKNYVMKEHNDFMDLEGYGRRGGSGQEKLKEALENSAEEINELLSEMGIDTIGDGEVIEPFRVRWVRVDFPVEGTSKVMTGDKIKNIVFEIKNNKGKQLKFNTELYVKLKDGTHLDIATEDITVAPDSKAISTPCDLEIDEGCLPRFEKLAIVLKVQMQDSNKVKEKQIPFYYDCEPQSRPEVGFSITPVKMEFPRSDSIRVNTGEKITGLTYVIKNNTAHSEKVGLFVRTHNMTESDHPIIQEILLRRDGCEIKPFSEVEIECGDVEFASEVYGRSLEKGVIELRASVSVVGTGKYSHADTVCEPSKRKIYFNCNPPGVSVFSESNAFDKKHGPRSEIDGSGREWTFKLNIGHPYYKMNEAQGDDARQQYVTEEMMKQTLAVMLSVGNYKIFSKSKSWFESDEAVPVQVVQELNETYDKLLWQKYGGANGHSV